MSCSLLVKITKGKDLVDSFYADLNVRDIVQTDLEEFGWTKDKEFTSKEDGCTEIITTVDNVYNTYNKCLSKYNELLMEIQKYEISKLLAKTKVVYNSISEELLELQRYREDKFNELLGLYKFYGSIILLADKKDIYDYSSLKVHMYLG